MGSQLLGDERDLRDRQFHNEETEAKSVIWLCCDQFLICKVGTSTSPLESWRKDMVHAMDPAKCLVGSGLFSKFPFLLLCKAARFLLLNLGEWEVSWKISNVNFYVCNEQH